MIKFLLLFFQIASAQFVPQTEHLCPERIREITCFVNGSNRNCAEHPDFDRTVDELVDIQEILPANLAPLFCTLARINIELDMPWATGYVRDVRTDEGPKAIMGLHYQRLLNDPIGIHRFLNGQHQTAYGSDRDHPQKVFPFQINIDILNGINHALLWTVIHEFAHLIDMYNSVNSFELIEGSCQNPQGEPDRRYCRHNLAGEFFPFSWTASSQHRESFHRAEDLFCRGCLKPSTDALPILNSFLDTQFISFYSTVSVMEDFAETLTFHIMDEYYSVDASIHTRDEMISINDRLNNQLAPKTDFVRDLLSGPLAYEFEETPQSILLID